MVERPHDLCETQTVGAKTRELIVPSSACPTLSNNHILGVGVSDAEAGFEFVRLRPDISVILACVSGQGEVMVEGNWRVCSKGTAYVTPSHTPHAYRAVEATPWRLCWVAYHTSKENDARLNLFAPSLIQIDPEPLHGVLTHLYREYTGAGDPMILHHLGELTQRYADRILQRWQPNDLLDALWASVDADLAYPWRVNELAKRVGMSSENLRLLCYEHIGRSPGKQLTYLRMQRATHLLSTTNWTVEAIALAVGYSDAFAFSTSFKRWVGLPPSGYRAERAPG